MSNRQIASERVDKQEEIKQGERWATDKSLQTGLKNAMVYSGRRLYNESTLFVVCGVCEENTCCSLRDTWSEYVL